MRRANTANGLRGKTQREDSRAP